MADLFTRTTTTTPNNQTIANAQWQAAQNVASKPYEAYTGTGVAALTPAQQQAYAMITGGGLQQAGQNTLNQSIAGTRAAMNFTPQQVAAPNLGMANTYAGAQLGPAQQAQAVDPIMASSYGGAVLDPAVRAEIERLGPAYLANAASVDRSAIQNVMANQGAQYMGAYQNPYESQVVQATLADLDRARQMAIVGAEDGALRSGAYGGSRHGVADSLTNEAALRQAALSAAQMRQAGFDTAANLGMTDANRMMQAALANQGVDLSAATSNAGFQQGANLANQSAQNQYGMANAQFGNAANLANAGFANERNIAQGNLSNQAGIASMQAANAAAVANAQLAQQRNLFNAGEQNNFAIQGAQMGLNAGIANQAAGLQGANLGLNAANQMGNLSNTQRTNYMQNASALETVGNAQQAQNQRQADWQYQQWLRQQNYPLQQLNVLNSVSGPSGGTVSTSPSLLSQIGQGVNIGGSLMGLL